MRIKRVFTLGVCLLVFALALLQGGPRINRTITITSGTPIQLATVPTYANRVFIQMLSGGTGIGYVMDMSNYLTSVTPNHSTSGHLTAQLQPASSTAPGGSYSDAADSAPGSGPIDISRIYIDGSNSGDTVVISYDLRN